ncbi:MAG: hypothetical protein ABIR76_05115 [Polaromonas sp.]
MTEPTKSPADIPSGDDAPAANLFAWVKASLARLRDWLSIQTFGMRFVVLLVALMIPASGYYAWATLERQEKMALEVKAMAAAGQGVEAAWTYNTALPVVFGSGSVLSFLEVHPVARITIIYRPILWTVSERFVLVESEGRQYAYYPSDMETKYWPTRLSRHRGAASSCLCRAARLTAPAMTCWPVLSNGSARHAPSPNRTPGRAAPARWSLPP